MLERIKQHLRRLVALSVDVEIATGLAQETVELARSSNGEGRTDKRVSKGCFIVSI